jgi:hypothetical protein
VEKLVAKLAGTGRIEDEGIQQDFRRGSGIVIGDRRLSILRKEPNMRSQPNGREQHQMEGCG